jgi:uncharacterized protein YjbK
MMIENEYKFLIEKECFYNLLQKAKAYYASIKADERIQINYYYDTDALELHKQNITLRARQTEDSLKLEVKRHLHKQDEFQTSNEIVCDIHHISNNLYASSHPALGLNPLQCYKLQGTLTTYRTTILQSDKVAIVFDKSFYLGICDYEIEIEFEKEHESSALSLINYLNLTQSNPLGKSTRFFNVKGRLNRGITI